MASDNKNLASQRREENGVVYFDRGTRVGRDGMKYDRFAIQTHFVEVGEDASALLEKYVRPLYQEGDCVAITAKVMAMCTSNVKKMEDMKLGFFAKLMARFAGINTDMTIIRTHMAGGLLASIGGIILSSRVTSAKASYGSSYILQCLLVAILGGINPNGGFGKVPGIVMAILTLQFLSSGFNMMRADSYFKTFIWGFVLIAAMIINYYGDKAAEKKKRAAAAAKRAAEKAAAEAAN